MRPDPQRPDGPNVVRIGGENSTIPAWYVVGINDNGDWESVSCRVLLEDDERRAIADGAELELTLYGGEVPWSIDIAPEAR